MNAALIPEPPSWELIRQITAVTCSVAYSVPLDSPGGTLYVSPELEAALGFSAAEWVADPDRWMTQLHPEDRPRVLAARDRTRATGEPFRVEYRMRGRDGRVLWFRDEALVMRNDAGLPPVLQGIRVDITTAKLAQEALRASEERYRRMFNRSLAGMFRTTRDGRMLECNESFARILGFKSPEEVLTHNAREFYVDPADRDRLIARIRPRQPLVDVELSFRRKDGEPIWVLMSLLEPENAGDSCLEGIILDITARKRAEEALLRLGSIVESSDDAIIGQTLKGIIGSSPAGAERTSGYRAEEVIGRSIALLVPPDRMDELSRILEQVRRGERVEPSETVRIRKDGSAVDVDVSVSPIRKAAGRVLGARVTGRGLTEPKRAEKAEHGAETLRVGLRLAVAAAHEINNALAALMGNLQLLSLNGETDPSTLTRIGRVRSCAQKIRDIVPHMGPIVRLELLEEPGASPALDLRHSATVPDDRGPGQRRAVKPRSAPVAS